MIFKQMKGGSFSSEFNTWVRYSAEVNIYYIRCVHKAIWLNNK